MTSSPHDPLRDHARTHTHVWVQALIGWQIAFWMFALGAVAILSSDDSLTGTRRSVGIAIVLAICLAFAVLRPPARDDLDLRNSIYLGIVIVGVGAAIAVDPGVSTLLFIAYPQMWIYGGSTRHGALFSVALTISAAAGLIARNGVSGSSLLAILPIMSVSVVSSILIGVWISRIIDQSAERAELITQLEETRSALGSAQHAAGVLAERERMAREIHDTLAQGFTSIIMLAQAGSSPTALARIETVARENLSEARALVAALSPVALDGSTLVDAVRRLGERFSAETGVAVTVSGSPLPGLTRDQEVVLLRAAQEALANVRKHACASSVTVVLSGSSAGAQLEVRDDGVGFAASAPLGFGLTGMRDRVRSVGGSVDVVSEPGQGTRVMVDVP